MSRTGYEICSFLERLLEIWAASLPRRPVRYQRRLGQWPSRNAFRQYILSMGAERLKKASQLAVLNANYVKEQLKSVLHLHYDRPCMHECVFSDKHQRKYKITTLDMAKRSIDYGYHPSTIYFHLVVNGAIMIEPTETESKEEMDHFVECFRPVIEEAEKNPELLHQAPSITKVKRLDEVGAGRKPCLAG